MSAVSDVVPQEEFVADTSGIAGHPRGLMTLFFTEMWERFSYYGMRAFLLLFMVAPIERGGLGFDDARGGLIFGTYASMVYLLSVPGGWVADRFLGQQRAVLIGGTLIMCGHISLAIPATWAFFLGLALVSLGTGLLKPNISTIVGQLYAPNDKRRDAGFTIFYMGINVGAFLAPLICGGFLAQSDTFKNWLISAGIEPRAAWHFAFGSAAVGMFFGLVQYVIGRRRLKDAGKYPTPPKDAAEASRNKMILAAIIGVFVVLPVLLGILGATKSINLTPETVGSAFDILLPLTAVVVLVGLYVFGATDAGEKKRMIVVIILFFAASVFWGCFEQAGSTLTLFADRNTDLHLFGIGFESTMYQSLNSFFVVCLAPLFAILWIRLAKSGKEPATVSKFGLGMVGVGLGFLVMVPAARIVMGGALAGAHWLVILYLIHTAGEMCLSPVGLSAMSRLAPARLGGLILGVWFLAASVGNYMAGRAVSLTKSMQMDHFFLLMTILPIAFGVVLFLIAKPVQRMLGAGGETGTAGGH